MLKYYLQHLTVYFLENTTMPEDLSVFNTDLHIIKHTALARHELDWLILGLAHIVFNPDIQLKAFRGLAENIEEGDLHHLLWHALNTLCPNYTPEKPSIPIELINMTTEEWDQYKSIFNNNKAPHHNWSKRN